MERALERAHAARHRRVHVGQRGRDHAGGERGGVQLVLRVEHERGVEGARGHRRGLLAGEHVEEVRGVAERLRWRHRREAVSDPVVGADRGGHLAREPRRLPPVGRAGVVGGVGIVHAEDGDGGLQDPHRVGLARHQREGPREAVGDGARRHQLGHEAIARGAAGQVALPQEIGDLLERGLPGQLVDVVAAIGEAGVRPVQIAQAGLGGDDAFEPADESRALRHGWLLSRWRRAPAGATLTNGIPPAPGAQGRERPQKSCYRKRAAARRPWWRRGEAGEACETVSGS